MVKSTSLHLFLIFCFLYLGTPQHAEATYSCIPGREVREVAEIGLDDAYVAETKASRGYEPEAPFSFFDSLRITLSLCAPQDIKMPWTAALYSFNDEGKEVRILTLPAFVEERQTSADVLTYTTLLSGKGGWLKGKDAEFLIESIGAKRLVFIRLASGARKVDVTLPTTACVRLYGSGPHTIVGIRGSTAMSPQMLSDKMEQFRTAGVGKVEPYRSRAERFSYMADMSLFPASLLVRDMIAGKNGDMSEVGRQSACEYASTYFLFAPIPAPASGGLAPRSLSTIGGRVAVVLPTVEPLHLMHVFSHTFAGLIDEYPLQGIIASSTLPLLNCSSDPRADFGTASTSLSVAGFPGCVASKVKNGAPLFRETEKSLMNYTGFATKFGLRSCGYILKAITGRGTVVGYRESCASPLLSQ